MFPKRGAIALVTTALTLVLLLSFKTPDTIGMASAFSDGAASISGATATPTAAPTTTTASPTTGTSGGSHSIATATLAPTAVTGTETVTGSTISTRYGDIAVQITVTNGQITDVQAAALPTYGHSGEISNYVAPILASEALRAQSAKIDIISGATYTSRAYAKSLQSAIDQAGIASVAVAG